MNRALQTLVVLAAGILPSVATAADYDVTFPIALRPGVSSRVVVTMRENPSRRHCLGGTLLTVPGLAHTAATWNPFIDQLFASQAGAVFCRVAAIDLPGHGKSGLPEGAIYGTLLMEDYVTVVAGVLDGFKTKHMPVRSVLGHSMGGLVVEALQSRLVSEGSNMAQRYGIHLAGVMSPGASREQPWMFADSGLGAQAISPFIITDPVEGEVLRADAATWEFFFFTNLSGQFSPGTPPLDQLPSLGYMSDEPLYASAELEGAPPFERISVGTTPFAPCHHTALLYINPSQDLINLRAEAQAGYVQLTGDTTLRGFIPVDDPYAVHDMFIAQPALLIQKIQQALLEHL